jgi:hypothetical protein
MNLLFVDVDEFASLLTVRSGPMGSYLLAETGNRPSLSKFLGFWAVMGGYMSLFGRVDADCV